MEKVNCATQTENVASFFVDVEGDIFDTLEAADVCGVVAEVVVDGFYVGSLDDIRAAALAKYNAAKQEC